MKIRWIITVILSLPAFFLAMRYHLHMFQLNGYKNGEHIRWLHKNIRHQWLLFVCMFLGAVGMFCHHIILDILGYCVLLLTIAVYQVLRKRNVKKKLVYTARVQRLIVTDCLLCGAPVAVLCYFRQWIFIPGVFLLLISFQLLLLVVANVINYPLEAGVRRHFINDAKRRLKEHPGLQIIGVTGSYGKTSVKFYLQTLLQEKYHVLVTPESFNTPMGVVRTIRESLQPSHEIFICEMGARHTGDIKEICDIVHPGHGMITSVGPQHLETFYHMDNIVSTKFELADSLPAGGLLFLNGDNEYIQKKSAEYDNIVFYFSEEKDKSQGYSAKNVSVSRLGTDFTVTAPDGSSECFQMRLVGLHNVINVVGAISVANMLGIALKDLRIPVRRLEPVEHRMQLRENGNVTIIDDAYNSNPVGSKAAVETLAMFDGMRILITPGMVELGEKEEEYNYQFGTYAAECCDVILLVGKQHTEPIRRGAESKGFPGEQCLIYDTLEEALFYAYAIKGQKHKYILLENDLPDNY